MKIAINLFAASPKSVTGAFVYIREILPALLRADGANTYHIIGHSQTVAYFKKMCGDFSNAKFRAFDIRRDVFANPIRAVRKLLAKVAHDDDAREAVYAEEVNAYIQTECIDIYFSPTVTIFPRGIRNVKIITTIHDLQYEYFPNNFSSSFLAERRDACSLAVKRSDRLISVSEFTKKTLVEKCNADSEKIKVIYHGLTDMKIGNSTIDIGGKFVLYPAALWPHKNHGVLIRALGMLRDNFSDLRVVCTGTIKSKKLKGELIKLAESEGVESRVLFEGFVSDSDLRYMYEHASALVFPSSFEGFGIPLVEAMHFGLPVIAADNTSITEVVDGAGILVKTGDAEALAEAIERVLTDKSLRDELIQKGRERAKLFSWDKAARETLKVFYLVNSR